MSEKERREWKGQSEGTGTDRNRKMGGAEGKGQNFAPRQNPEHATEYNRHRLWMTEKGCRLCQLLLMTSEVIRGACSFTEDNSGTRSFARGV